LEDSFLDLKAVRDIKNKSLKDVKQSLKDSRNEFRNFKKRYKFFLFKINKI
jgi:hypothetical protein